NEVGPRANSAELDPWVASRPGWYNRNLSGINRTTPTPPIPGGERYNKSYFTAYFAILLDIFGD
ncbi:MAG: hypothetical protein NTY66_02340, partial [Candidatus Vogelbacteria bacterium]|nr:hypothetical protein [Candidatus Vogelbacteria bacterium]